jgi:hypothetical protein
MKEETKGRFDLVGATIDFEAGEQEPADTLELFAYLIRTGQAWRLQGYYGRSAANLIRDGFITPEGEITEAGHAAVADASPGASPGPTD